MNSLKPSLAIWLSYAEKWIWAFYRRWV